MSLGVNTVAPAAPARASRQAVSDRRLTRAMTGTFGVSPSLEVTRTEDPSDGANVSGGSSYVPGMPLLPSSAGLAGVLGASDEGILQKISASNAYLARMAGKSWPSVATPPNFLRPTAYAQRSSINKGWNAAAQPGDAPGLAGCGCSVPLQDRLKALRAGYAAGTAARAAGNGVAREGFSNIDVGPMSWEEALLYSPAPLTENIGALRGLDEIYREPQTDLRPGFGEVSGDTLLPLAAIGGLVWWLLSR